MSTFMTKRWMEGLAELVKRHHERYDRMGPGAPSVSAWLDAPRLKVYVRMGSRYVKGKKRPTLELANVWVRPEFRRRGYFKQLLAFLTDLAKRLQFRLIYIEQVVSPELFNFFHKKRWAFEEFDGTPSFYRHLRINTRLI